MPETREDPSRLQAQLSPCLTTWTFWIRHMANWITSFILDAPSLMPDKNPVVRDKIPYASIEAGS